MLATMTPNDNRDNSSGVSKTKHQMIVEDDGEEESSPFYSKLVYRSPIRSVWRHKTSQISLINPLANDVCMAEPVFIDDDDNDDQETKDDHHHQTDLTKLFFDTERDGERSSSSLSMSSSLSLISSSHTHSALGLMINNNRCNTADGGESASENDYIVIHNNHHQNGGHQDLDEPEEFSEDSLEESQQDNQEDQDDQSGHQNLIYQKSSTRSPMLDNYFLQMDSNSSDTEQQQAASKSKPREIVYDCPLVNQFWWQLDPIPEESEEEAEDENYDDETASNYLDDETNHVRIDDRNTGDDDDQKNDDEDSINGTNIPSDDVFFEDDDDDLDGSSMSSTRLENNTEEPYRYDRGNHREKREKNATFDEKKSTITTGHNTNNPFSSDDSDFGTMISIDSNKGPLHQSEEELLSPNEDLGPESRNAYRKLLSIEHQHAPPFMQHQHQHGNLFFMTDESGGGDQEKSEELTRHGLFVNGQQQSHPLHAQYLIPPPLLSCPGIGNGRDVEDEGQTLSDDGSTGTTSTTTTGCLIAATAQEIHQVAEEVVTTCSSSLTSNNTTTTTNDRCGSGSHSCSPDCHYTCHCSHHQHHSVCLGHHGLPPTATLLHPPLSVSTLPKTAADFGRGYSHHHVHQPRPGTATLFDLENTSSNSLTNGGDEFEDVYYRDRDDRGDASDIAQLDLSPDGGVGSGSIESSLSDNQQTLLDQQQQQAVQRKSSLRGSRLATTPVTAGQSESNLMNDNNTTTTSTTEDDDDDDDQTTTTTVMVRTALPSKPPPLLPKNLANTTVGSTTTVSTNNEPKTTITTATTSKNVWSPRSSTASSSSSSSSSSTSSSSLGVASATPSSSSIERTRRIVGQTHSINKTKKQPLKPGQKQQQQSSGVNYLNYGQTVNKQPATTAATPPQWFDELDYHPEHSRSAQQKQYPPPFSSTIYADLERLHHRIITASSSPPLPPPTTSSSTTISPTSKILADSVSNQLSHHHPHHHHQQQQQQQQHHHHPHLQHQRLFEFQRSDRPSSSSTSTAIQIEPAFKFDQAFHPFHSPSSQPTSAYSSLTLPRNMTIMTGVGYELDRDGGGGGGHHVTDVYEPRAHPVHKYWTLPRGIATGNGYEQHSTTTTTTSTTTVGVESVPKFVQDKFDQSEEDSSDRFHEPIVQQKKKSTTTLIEQSQKPRVQHKATSIVIDGATSTATTTIQRSSFGQQQTSTAQDNVDDGDETTLKQQQQPADDENDQESSTSMVPTKESSKETWYKSWVRDMRKMEQQHQKKILMTKQQQQQLSNDPNTILVKVKSPRYKGTDYHLSTDERPKSQHQPGNIADYEPGVRSSIFERERELFYNDIFNYIDTIFAEVLVSTAAVSATNQKFHSKLRKRAQSLSRVPMTSSKSRSRHTSSSSIDGKIGVASVVGQDDRNDYGKIRPKPSRSLPSLRLSTILSSGSSMISAAHESTWLQQTKQQLLASFLASRSLSHPTRPPPPRPIPSPLMRRLSMPTPTTLKLKPKRSRRSVQPTTAISPQQSPPSTKTMTMLRRPKKKSKKPLTKPVKDFEVDDQEEEHEADDQKVFVDQRDFDEDDGDTREKRQTDHHHHDPDNDGDDEVSDYEIEDHEENGHSRIGATSSKQPQQASPTTTTATTVPKQAYYHEKCVFNTLTGASSPKIISSSQNGNQSATTSGGSGYDSDSSFIVKKTSTTMKTAPKPASPSVYRAVQRGEDIPLTGLQRTAPARQTSRQQTTLRTATATIVGPQQESKINVQYRLPTNVDAGRSDQTPIIPSSTTTIRSFGRRHVGPCGSSGTEIPSTFATRQPGRSIMMLPSSSSTPLSSSTHQQQPQHDLSSPSGSGYSLQRHHYVPLSSPMSPVVPLDRYDRNFIITKAAGPMTSTPDSGGEKKLARVLYDFQAMARNELAVKKGDMVVMRKSINHNWVEVEDCSSGLVGFVPRNYLDFEQNGIAKAKFDFNAKTSVEIRFKKGEQLTLLRRVDDNWFEGINERGDVGIFPVTYVDVVRQPTVKPFGTGTITTSSNTSSEKSSQSPSSSMFGDRGGGGVSHQRSSSQTSSSSMASVQPANKTGILYQQFQLSSMSLSGPMSSMPQLPTTSGQIIQHHHHHGSKPSYSSRPDSSLSATMNIYFSSTSSEPGGYLPSQHQIRRAPDASRQLGGTVERFCLPKPRIYRVLYPYKPQQTDELELQYGDLLTVTIQCDDGWFLGRSTLTGKFGTFPGNYVEPV